VLSGIYKIICINNKFYIGSSNNINRRLKEHIRLLNKNKHNNLRLQKAWNEYGKKNFKFEIIETIHNIKQLPIREKWWLDTTNCCDRKIGFNISSNPFCTKGGRKFIDLTGKIFNRLFVISLEKYVERGKSTWLCKCICGKEIIVRGDQLKIGHTKSCGCLHKEIITTHGHSSSGKPSTTYYSWQSMIQRCNNKNNHAYEDYGGRDKPIIVCGRWLDKKYGFKNFLEDMGERSPGLTLDRIDNNKGYFKVNCRWATPKEQQINTRSNINVPYNGKYICLKDYCKIKNLNYNAIEQRINKLGWSIEKATTTKIRKKKVNNG